MGVIPRRVAAVRWRKLNLIGLGRDVGEVLEPVARVGEITDGESLPRRLLPASQVQSAVLRARGDRQVLPARDDAAAALVRNPPTDDAVAARRIDCGEEEVARLARFRGRQSIGTEPAQRTAL